MKKKITFCTVVLLICFFTVKIFAASYNVKITVQPASSTSVELGKTIDVLIGFTNINGTGVTTANGKLEYDKNVFEHVISDNVEVIEDSGWEGLLYNDSGNDADGSFVADTKNTLPIKENHNFLKVKLKVKENATIGKTEVKVTRICSNF